MADAKWASLVQVPAWPNGNFSFQALAMDATGDKVAVVFQATDAITVTHLGFRYSLRTGTPPTYRISLQGVGTDGTPDGTVKGGASAASATFAPPADATWNGTWQWVELDNPYTTTRGELLAWAIEYSAGTVDGSNNGSFTHGVNFLGTSISRVGIPYSLRNTGSWTKETWPVFGYKSASATYGFPLSAQNDTTLTVNGTRSALKFTFPAEWGDTFKIVGVRFVGASPVSGNTWLIGLWNASGVLQDVTLDSDANQNPGSGIRGFEVYFDEATLATLSFGTAYYLGIERTSANCTLNGLDVGVAADMSAHPGGVNCHLATYDGATWTDVQTNRPFIEPILADITEPSGGSGGGYSRGRLVNAGA